MQEHYFYETVFVNFNETVFVAHLTNLKTLKVFKKYDPVYNLSITLQLQSTKICGASRNRYIHSFNPIPAGGGGQFDPPL